MKRLGMGSVVVLIACAVWARSVGPPRTALTPESLEARIKAMKVAGVAWRQIAWKNCLLEGLKESRSKKKPVLLWIFIDRPIDDARC
jgi:hypothetical protein